MRSLQASIAALGLPEQWRSAEAASAMLMFAASISSGLGEAPKGWPMRARLEQQMGPLVGVQQLAAVFADMPLLD